MSISRDVIMDLLPVYLAGESSEDTRRLVEEYLQSDKELAKMVAESHKTPFTEDVRTPISKETEMESLRKTQAMIHRTILFVAGVILFVSISLMLVLAGIVYVMFR